jgi:hypothetical protein
MSNSNKMKNRVIPVNLSCQSGLSIGSRRIGGSFLSFCLFVGFLAVISLLTANCARRDPEAERRAAISDTLAKLRSCAPESANDAAGSNLRLTISSIALNPNETSLRLLAFAPAEAVVFDLPVYYLSRGRWLINEKGRAYLLDEDCREYKLRDKKISAGQTASQDGKIKLNPGQASEVTLSFPRLPDRTRMGLLIYGDRVLPFTLWDKSR